MTPGGSGPPEKHPGAVPPCHQDVSRAWLEAIDIPHTALNLARNVSPAAVRRYKLTSLGVIRDAAGLVHRSRQQAVGAAAGGP
jgi:hypothetical protein